MAGWLIEHKSRTLRVWYDASHMDFPVESPAPDGPLKTQAEDDEHFHTVMGLKTAVDVQILCDWLQTNEATKTMEFVNTNKSVRPVYEVRARYALCLSLS